MKIILSIILLTGIAYAELPDIIKDPGTKEVVEYLDSKMVKVVSGLIDMGIESVSVIQSGGVGTTLTATCPNDKQILTGSCYATDGDLRMCGSALSPSGGWPWKSWTAVTTGTGYKEVHISCARIK